jgi:hypothetical protein
MVFKTSWEEIGNLGNTLKMHWEHSGNTLRICWDVNILGTQDQKIQTASPKEKIFVYWVHVASHHWLSIIFIPNYVHHLIFPRLL